MRPNFTGLQAAFSAGRATVHFSLFLCFFLCAGSVAAQQTRTSVKSGQWNGNGVWDCDCTPGPDDHIIVASGHAVTINGTSRTVSNLTIQPGGFLDNSGNPTLTIAGHLVINGTLSGDMVVYLTGANSTISGTGSITNTGEWNITGSKTILAGTDLAKNTGNINIAGASTVTNAGSFTIGASITGVAGSAWTNGESSTLNIAGALLSTGVLNASAPGNTVNYYASGGQAIKLPSAVNGLATYHHLTISGTSGTKTLSTAADYAVNGNLTISSILSIGNSVSTKTLYVRGNWNNLGGFTRRLGTVVFDGTGVQTITRQAGLETFRNVTINKVSGSVVLGSNVTVEGALVFSSSNTANIEASSLALAVGISRTEPGSLTYNGTGYIVGSLKRWVTEAGVDLVFPIGTSLASRTAVLAVNNLQKGGSLTASFVEAYPGNAGLPLQDDGTTVYNTFRDGYWSLLATAADSLSSDSYNIRLSGNGFSGFTIAAGTRVVRRTSTGSPWSLAGTHEPSVGNTAGRNAVALSGLQHFAFADLTNCTAPTGHSISGLTATCAGTASVVYSIPDNAGSTYAWTVDGGTFTGGGTHAISVNWASTGLSGKVTVVESNACTQGPLSELTVNVHAMPPVFSMARYFAPANGDPVTYAVTALPGYTYSWTISGGTIQSGHGTNTVSVNWGDAGTGTICAQAIYNACGSSASTCIDVTKYTVISSVQSGNYQNSATWDCSCVPTATDNVMIRNTHNVNVQATGIWSANNVIINTGGSLTFQASNRQLDIYGDLTVNGTLSGAGSINLLGNGLLVNGRQEPSFIEGTGSVSHTGEITVRSSRTISPYTDLVKIAGNVRLDAGVVIINEGKIAVGGNLVSAVAEDPATWVNGANATLMVGGTLLTPGTLVASAPGNTVVYSGTGALQNIIAPENGQYANLSMTGTTKIATGGTLRISETFTVDAPFIHTSAGTVDFNGAGSIVGSVAPSFHHLTVTGSLLSSPGEITVAGNFSNHGSFTHNQGTVNFNGTSGVSLIGGSASLTSFYNLQANNSSGVRAETNVDLYGTLSVGTATVFDADGAGGNRIFTVRSTSDSPAQDGSIGPLLGNARVSGLVTVQRYLSNPQKMYRYLASPLGNTTIAQWLDNFTITGNFTGASSGSVCGITINAKSPTLYYYNETIADTTKRYIAYPTNIVGGINAPVVRGKGYSAYMRSDCAPTVVDVRGPVQEGPFTFQDLTHTSAGTHLDGFQLVGNPYPSAIDWSSADGWDARTNVYDVAYIRNNKMGTFEVLDGNENTPQIIALGQAFWVKVMNPGNGTLSINETAKTNMQHAFYRESAVQKDHLIITLSRGDLRDVAYNKVRSFAEQGRDKTDGLKIQNDNFDVFIISPDNYRMAINSTPVLGCGDPLKIGIRNTTPGNYSLSLETLGRYNHMQFTLKDEWTGETVQLEKLEYNFSVTSDPASARTHRFTIFPNQKNDIAPVALAYPEVTCDGSATLTIEGSLEGVTYQVLNDTDSLVTVLAGNGSTVNWSLPGNLLSQGENRFNVQSVLTCGEVSDRQEARIYMSEKPGTPDAVAGKSCGAGSVNLHVEGTATTDRVNWYENETDETPAFTGTAFTTGALGKSATWYVERINEHGCHSERVAVRAEIVHVSSPVIIEQSGQVLTTEEGAIVNWYFDNALLETSASVTVQESGVYSAEAVLSGCSARTDYSMVVSGFEESFTLTGVYPNPFTNRITVTESGEKIRMIALQDATGKVIALNELRNEVDNVRVFDVSSFAPGFYMLRIVYANRTAFAKVIKE